MVARSASFCAIWPSVEASLAFCSATWLASSRRCISISGRDASAGGLNSASGSSLARAACRRAASSWRRHQVALQVPELGGVHGGIEFDQHVARLDALAVAHMDRTHHARLERLDDLGAAGGDDLARGHGHDVDRADARPGEGGGRTPRPWCRRSPARSATAASRRSRARPAGRRARPGGARRVARGRRPRSWATCPAWAGRAQWTSCRPAWRR